MNRVVIVICLVYQIPTVLDELSSQSFQISLFPMSGSDRFDQITDFYHPNYAAKYDDIRHTFVLI